MFKLMRGAATLAGGLVLVLAAQGARAQEPDPNAVPYYPRHAVFRPAFNIPTRKPLLESGYEFPTKPIFLKGYAGYNYGRGPREAFIPTGYGTGYIAPVGVGSPAPAGPCLPRRRWLRR